MTSISFKLQPQTGLLVAASSNYVQPGPAVLTAYYQPLLTPNAGALYWALINRLRPQPQLSERDHHTSLLDQLGIGITALDQARQRLEGVGLVRTFFKVDALGPVALYQVQPPSVRRPLSMMTS